MQSFTTCTSLMVLVSPITILVFATKSQETSNTPSNTIKKASLICHQQKHLMLQDMHTTAHSKRPKTRRLWKLPKHTIKRVCKRSLNTTQPFSTQACSSLRDQTSKKQFFISSDAATQFAVASTDSSKHITRETTLDLLTRSLLPSIKTNKQ